MNCLKCAQPGHRWVLKSLLGDRFERDVHLCDGCSRNFAIWATQKYGQIELTFAEESKPDATSHL